MIAPLTVADLEAALRALGVEHCSAALLGGVVAVSLRVRDAMREPVAVTGEGATLDGAMVDAMRKCGAR